MKPASPLLGTTSRPSSVNTLHFEPIVNFDVFTSPSAVMMDVPKPTASEAPKLSVMAAFGIWRSRPRLTSVLHITPEEMCVVVEKLDGMCPDAIDKSTSEEIEISIDKIDTRTLRELDGYVNECLAKK